MIITSKPINMLVMLLTRQNKALKIHLVVDACGNPIDFLITGGQVHDVKVAPQLIEQNKQVLSKHTEALSADIGYDCDELRGVN
ncbi:transposase [Moraxella lacunata]|nr:transposase [Moraxella lacunata]